MWPQRQHRAGELPRDPPSSPTSGRALGALQDKRGRVGLTWPGDIEVAEGRRLETTWPVERGARVDDTKIRRPVEALCSHVWFSLRTGGVTAPARAAGSLSGHALRATHILLLADSPRRGEAQMKHGVARRGRPPHDGPKRIAAGVAWGRAPDAPAILTVTPMVARPAFRPSRRLAVVTAVIPQGITGSGQRPRARRSRA